MKSIRRVLYRTIGLAAVGGLDDLVAVGEAADVDAEAVGLGIDPLPDRHAEDGVVDPFLGARAGSSPMMSTAPRSGIDGVLAGLDDRDGLGDHRVFEPLAGVGHQAELRDEHPRLAGVVDHPVIEVVDDLAGPCPGISTVRSRTGLKAKSRTQIPSLSRGKSEASTIWTLKPAGPRRTGVVGRVGTSVTSAIGGGPGSSGDRLAARPGARPRRCRRLPGAAGSSAQAPGRADRRDQRRARTRPSETVGGTRNTLPSVDGTEDGTMRGRIARERMNLRGSSNANRQGRFTSSGTSSVWAICADLGKTG